MGLHLMLLSKKTQLKKRITLINGGWPSSWGPLLVLVFSCLKGVYEHSGSLAISLIIWTLCGVFSMFGALCYAELGTCITKSGGDYAYILEAFGPATAFLRLWVGLLVIRPATQAVLALTFGYYMLDPFYPTCQPPDEALRLLAAVCLCSNPGVLEIPLYREDRYTMERLGVLSVGVVKYLRLVTTQFSSSSLDLGSQLEGGVRHR
ncbi:y+L amino acid transporter 2 [Trichonephila clavipes]|nr:y+L amino acid transporter 2 [Trichonephila clavipes]